MLFPPTNILYFKWVTREENLVPISLILENKTLLTTNCDSRTKLNSRETGTQEQAFLKGMNPGT